MHRSLPPCLLAIACLCTRAPAFDTYLPVDAGQFQGNAGLVYTAQTGYYDDDGNHHKWSSDPAAFGPQLQAKYGVVQGLDVELSLQYVSQNKDAGDKSGLARPQLGLKYASPEVGLGGFLNATLPLGSEDIVGSKPQTMFEGGLIFGKSNGQASVFALAGYIYQTESSKTKIKQDGLELYLRGQFNPIPSFGPYFAIDWTKAFDAKYDGNTIDKSSGYLLCLQPGMNLDLDKSMSLEFQVPFTVAGANAYSFWGFAAYFKFRT